MSLMEKARARLERALNEAAHRHMRRDQTDKELLREAAYYTGQANRKFLKIFDKIQENPCASCGRCCTGAAFQSGFHTHTEREALLEHGVDLRDYIVEDWQDQPEVRCLFLAEDGCNIPVEHRSATCSGYICHDRLGPSLEREGLTDNLEAAREEAWLAASLRSGTKDVPFEENVNCLGEG